MKPHSFLSVASSASSDGKAGSAAGSASADPAPNTKYREGFDDGKNARDMRRDEHDDYNQGYCDGYWARDRVRRIPIIAGYDSHDIEHAIKGLKLAQDFALAAFRCHLENNEHVMSFVDFESFAAGLRDMVGDELIGPLQKRLDEMRGDR